MADSKYFGKRPNIIHEGKNVKTQQQNIVISKWDNHIKPFTFSGKVINLSLFYNV